MKICPNIPFADAKEERRQGERAFTMVEIAIAIGVIGFALVAIIGILPAGMSVQKDNREDTTIGEDAPVFLNAIRTGSTNTGGIPPVTGGLDYLTNYVERIEILGVTNGVIVSTNFNLGPFDNSWQILGLLSTPQMLDVNSGSNTLTRVIVRALGGAAVQQNGANSATAFRYQMDVQIVPFVNFAPDTTNYLAYDGNTNSPDYITRYNRWLEAAVGATAAPSVNLTSATGALAYNMYDVRLHFSWPVLSPAGVSYIVVGPNQKNYRTMVASGIVKSSFFLNSTPLWFFQPESYANQSTIAAQ